MINKTVRVLLAVVIAWVSAMLISTKASATVRCGTPGTVENRSSKAIKIRYDNNAGQIVVSTLNPGQNSSNIFCDVDQFTVGSGSFTVYGTNYAANYFYPNGAGNGSIGWAVWRCWNGGTGTSGVICAKFI